MNRDIFNRNIEALKSCKPALADLVLHTADVPAISLEKTKDGEDEIFCNFANGIKKSYHDGASPAEFGCDLVNRLSFKNPRIVVFLGMGLGLHILEYFKNPHPQNEVVLMVEAFPQVFKKALEVNDFSKFLKLKEVQVCVGSDPEVLKKFLGDFFSNTEYLQYANAIEYVPFPPAIKLTPKYYEDVQKILPQAIGHQFNLYFGDPFDGYIGTENTVKNIPRLKSMAGFYQAENLFAKKPGVVIASGPSLEYSIPILKKLQDRVVMAACPSALPVLIENKLEPHVWVNIERPEEMGVYFKDLKSKPPHVFVTTPHVHPVALDENGGLNAYLLSGNQQCFWLPLDGPNEQIGQSAAHAAFHVLKLLGCDPIFLVGQDLCYSETDSHAGGVMDMSTVTMKRILDENKKVLELEGNSGYPVKTSLYWLTFLKSYCEDVFPKCKSKIYNVIPSNMGVKIPGVERINPEELEDLVGDDQLNVLANLQEKLRAPSAEKQKDINEKFAKKILLVKETLKLVSKEAREFSLKCKSLQFHEAVVSRNWTVAEGLYKSFLNDLQKYATRFFCDPAYANFTDSYQNFFRPIIQGMLLRYRIEYHTHSSDLNGDFNEISRKAEILFHMAKDEAFWAEACLDLLDPSPL